jgi:hypothetical protein
MNKYNPDAGESFYNFMVRVKKQIREDNGLFGTVKFNGIEIEVSHDSNINDLGIIYDLKRKLLQRII